MDELHVVAILYAKNGRQAYLSDDLKKVVHASVKEDGNIRYELHEDANDERRFILLEEWKDSDAQAQHHYHSEHIAHFHEKGEENVESREAIYFLKRLA